MEQTRTAPRRPVPRRATPLQRNRRLQGQLLSYVLIGGIVLFMVLGMLAKDREFSDTENRALAQKPAITKQSLLDGSYLKGLGTYLSDQFPGRDKWMSVDLGLKKALGQQESSGVYLCADDYLMQVPDAPNETQLKRNLDAINDFAARHSDLNVVMTVAPNAVTVLADKLPENAPVRDQRADLAGIRDALQGVQFIDVTDALLQHKSDYLYYRTDHHWTSQAAMHAFGEIAPALKITPPEPDTYQVYTVSETFEGTLSSRSGSHGAKDTVQLYIPETGIDYCVNYPDSPQAASSMYYRQALDVKDHYTVFFGGNYSRVDITTTADTGRSLLVFKDSYANCMMQFLYPYFDHITMIDPRYYYDNLEGVIRSEAITDVLYLYNADTFLGDSSLADVLTSGAEADAD